MPPEFGSAKVHICRDALRCGHLKDTEDLGPRRTRCVGDPKSDTQSAFVEPACDDVAQLGYLLVIEARVHSLAPQTFTGFAVWRKARAMTDVDPGDEFEFAPPGDSPWRVVDEGAALP